MKLTFGLYLCISLTASAVAQDAPAKIADLGTSNVILTFHPLDRRIETLIIAGTNSAVRADVSRRLARSGLEVTNFKQFNARTVAKEVLEEGTALFILASDLSNSLIDSLFDLNRGPIVHRLEKGFAASPVSLVRNGAVFIGQGEAVDVGSQLRDVLLINGNTGLNITTLLASGGAEARNRLISAGFTIAAQEALTMQSVSKLRGAGAATFIAASNFSSPSNDVILNSLTEPRVFAIDANFEIVPQQIVRVTGSVTRVFDEETIATQTAQLEPESSELEISKSSRLIARPNTAKQDRTKPVPSDLEPDTLVTVRNDEVDETLRLAKRHSAGCYRLFNWLSRYLREYEVDPSAVQAFDDMAFSVRRERNPAAVPIVKLFLPEQFALLFPSPPANANLAYYDQQMRYVKQCASSVIPSKQAAASYYPLASFVTSFGPKSRNEQKLSRLVSQIQSAYRRRDQALSVLSDAEHLSSTDDLNALRKSNETLTPLLWPNDAKAYLNEFALLWEAALNRAAENDLQEEQERRDLLAQAAEREQKQREAKAQNCIKKMTHPDDPDRAEDVAGLSDQEISQFVNQPVGDCLIARELFPDDPQVQFFVARATLFSDDPRKAVVELVDAATSGNAVAFAYLSEFEASPEGALELLQISFDLGFGPAIELAAEVEKQVIKFAEFQDEERRLKESLEQERKNQLLAKSKAIRSCDVAARHPLDDTISSITPITDDQIDPEVVVEECSKAITFDPKNGRLRFQLTRGLNLFEGFDAQIFSELKRSSDEGYGLASYVLFEEETDDTEALKLLRLSARQGFKSAIELDAKILKQPSSPKNHMVFRDVGNVETVVARYGLADDVKMHTTSKCFRDYQMWEGNSTAATAYLEALYEIFNEREVPFDYKRKMSRLDWDGARELAKAWCGHVSKSYGVCIDIILTEFNGDLLNKLDEVTHNTIMIANSPNARGSDTFFDRFIGDLTDYAGYFYARNLGVISPFDAVEFDGAYMFTDKTDEVVIEVSRELIKSSKMFVILGAFPSQYVCS